MTGGKVSTQAEGASSYTSGGRNIEFLPASSVEVKAGTSKPEEWKGCLLAYGVYHEGVMNPPVALAGPDGKPGNGSSAFDNLDSALRDFLAELVHTYDFTGKQGSSCFARFGGTARVVGLVGLGPAAKASAVVPWGKSPFQEAGNQVALAAVVHKASSAAITVLPSQGASASQADMAEKLAVGVGAGAYKSTRYKAKPYPNTLKKVEILLEGLDDKPFARAAASVKGVTMTRCLVESPANICTPQHLADAAQSIADSAPDCMKCEVIEQAQIEEMGMGLYLGVSACSDLPPKLIHLTYTPPGGSGGKVIGIVGKGLTFDSGGYNLKVGGMIEQMKWDMGGCGAVLGAAQALAGIKPPGVTVHIISAACENMISGKVGSLHPGDILTSASGKTVEIDNTDAEGRLTLADALWFAQEKCGVTAVVDIATLTGACMIALGKEVAGLFTPSDSMADAIVSASRSSGEKFWRLPMEEAQLKNLDSAIADLKNTGIQSRFGGAITAAMFLKEFVNTEKVEWAHLDIAGTAWGADNQATGYGALTLAEWCIAQGANSK